MSFVEASGHRLRKDRRQLTGPDSEQNVLWRPGKGYMNHRNNSGNRKHVEIETCKGRTWFFSQCN